MAKTTYDGFWDFYPFYLSQHLDRRCRVLHYIGTSLAVVLLIYAVVTGRWAAALLAPVAGYAFAWAGHFFFEKNRPATFSYPLMSLKGDFVMLFQAATGRLRLPDGPGGDT